MDAAVSAEIDPGRVRVVLPDDYELPDDGVHTRWPDSPMAQEERLQRHKIYAARAFARANKLNSIELDSDNARLGIVTTGKSYLDTLQALSDLGIDDRLAAKIGIRLYKVGMSWPLEPVMTHKFAEGLEEILVVEEKRSVIEDQLTGQLYNWPVDRRPRVVGEYDEDRNLLVTNLGELTPAMIARVIAARIARFFDSESIQQRLAFLETKEAALAPFLSIGIIERNWSIETSSFCSLQITAKDTIPQSCSWYNWDNSSPADTSEDTKSESKKNETNRLCFITRTPPFPAPTRRVGTRSTGLRARVAFRSRRDLRSPRMPTTPTKASTALAPMTPMGTNAYRR